MAILFSTIFERIFVIGLFTKTLVLEATTSFLLLILFMDLVFGLFVVISIPPVNVILKNSGNDSTGVVTV